MEECYFSKESLGRKNQALKRVSEGIHQIAKEFKLPYVDLFMPTYELNNKNENFTIDGFQLNKDGYDTIATIITNAVFGFKNNGDDLSFDSKLKNFVKEKNWYWNNDYHIPNGVHVYGVRREPHGSINYPKELSAVRKVTNQWDSIIWNYKRGREYEIMTNEEIRSCIPEVKVQDSYADIDFGSNEYYYGESAERKLIAADGFEVKLYAYETEFEEFANPVQIAFDNKDRLWVAVMPAYPHYKIGSDKPNDKILILEDTNGDFVADKQIVFADSIHLPTGFEIVADGVLVAQGNNLIKLIDSNNDDVADIKEIVLSGFDDHDTHTGISAFCADASGAVVLAEGLFNHSNIETKCGTVRGTNGGFYRYHPLSGRLKRIAQMSIPNPFGIAIDQWGQLFYQETSNHAIRWMTPSEVKPRYGVATHKSFNIIEDKHGVKPTCGMEFISSEHFPDTMQGDLLINNTVGFLGIKQHKIIEDENGYRAVFHQDLLKSDDKNFRPVDLEFASDGSLYIADWHNKIIDHMNYSSRDPLRDHSHGRIYRLTSINRPLTNSSYLEGKSIIKLLDLLSNSTYRIKYKVKRELRKRNREMVIESALNRVKQLETENKLTDIFLFEIANLIFGLEHYNKELTNKLINSSNPRLRAAIVSLIRNYIEIVENPNALLSNLISDTYAKVRLETIVTASWLKKQEGLLLLSDVLVSELDSWSIHAYNTAYAHLHEKALEKPIDTTKTHLMGSYKVMYRLGKEVYLRPGSCATCHLSNGKGLPEAGYPPLVNSEWVTGDKETLIKLVMKGFAGPISVNNVNYPGTVPMMGFENKLNDKELAAVLTYIRNDFGNRADPIAKEEVSEIRQKLKEVNSLYNQETIR